MSAEVDPFAEFGFEAAPRSSRPIKAFAREAAKGLGGTYGDILDILGAQSKRKLTPGQEAQIQSERNVPESLLPFFTSDENAPEFSRLASSEDVEGLLNMLNIPREEKGILEKGAGRFGRLLGSGTAFGAPAPGLSALGAAGGQIAEELGAGPVGEAIGEIAGILSPAAIKGLGRIISKAPKKLPSGITQPRAVDKKLAKFGAITPARQTKILGKLDEEAAALSKASIERHLPISKQIQEGFDFEKKFQEGFGRLEKVAARANPEIDITPISDLMAKNRRKYSGIPQLHPEAKKIVQELRAFGNRPQTSLKNLIKIYRSNNQKIKGAYEGARLHGKQQEYVDFLTSMNKAISDSIKRTLPEDSSFVKNFENLNREYGGYKKAQKTLSELRKFSDEPISPAFTKRLASDPKTQNKLALSMGKEGAKEITQIAKDLNTARDAVKKIPVKKIDKWDAIFPLGILIPGIKLPAGVATIAKGKKYAEFAYGFWLSSPAKAKAVDKALKAIITRDLNSYRQAAIVLKKDLRIDESDPFEEFGFTQSLQ